MRLVDKDPLTGLETHFEYQPDTDTTVIKYVQDTTAVIEDNKAAMQDEDRHRKQAKAEWAHYAKIPIIVQMEWLQKYGVNFADRNHWPRVMGLLNSPEYKYLKRTTYYHDR